jgi:hypothetical protein
MNISVSLTDVSRIVFTVSNWTTVASESRRHTKQNTKTMQVASVSQGMNWIIKTATSCIVQKTFITSDIGQNFSSSSWSWTQVNNKKSSSDGSEILTSSPFKIKAEKKRRAKIDNADQQRKRKENRGKNFLKKSQKTKSHNTRKDDCNPVLKWMPR